MPVPNRTPALVAPPNGASPPDHATARDHASPPADATARGDATASGPTRAAALTASLALALVLLLLPTPPAAAQTPTAADFDAATVDVTSVDTVVEALYASISGPAGAPRDWELFLHLMHPTAGQLISMTVNAAGEPIHSIITPEAFVQAADAGFVQNGFFETELGFTEDRFGNMIHRFSAYDSKRAESDPEPFSRGINSIQLIQDQGRWWIVTILWDRERPDNPIPHHLLSGRYDGHHESHGEHHD